MAWITSIIVSAIVGLSALIVGYNYLPLTLLEKFAPTSQPQLGATITTIQGTDTLKDSRSTINTNFTNLNTDKIEVSTTSVGNITTLSNLVTVGTITSGTWTGSVIDVARQGTGSTSPTLDQIILGNGTSGFKVVSGLGASGQFLQSNGAGTPPTWATSAIDQAATYSWTGAHTFSTATTTLRFGLEPFVGIGTTTCTMGTLCIEASTTTPPFYIGDKGSTSPVFVVHNTASTTFATNWTLFNQAVVKASSTVQTASGNPVAFDAENFDTCNCHDNVTNNSRLIAPVDGYYMVTAFSIDTIDVAGTVRRYIRRNGTENLGQYLTTWCNCGTYYGTTLTTTVALNKDDYIELVTEVNGTIKANMTLYLIGK